MKPVAKVAEVHMSRYTIEWLNGPIPEGTVLYAKADHQGAAQQFIREHRYIVVKAKDLASVPQELQDEFIAALKKVDAITPARQCVVVESDWPEYEPTWKMIEARCGVKQTPTEVSGGWSIPEWSKQDDLGGRVPSDVRVALNEAYQAGARAGTTECREFMAAFIEPQSKELAASIRANWNPAWGNDPKSASKQDNYYCEDCNGTGVYVTELTPDDTGMCYDTEPCWSCGGNTVSTKGAKT